MPKLKSQHLKKLKKDLKTLLKKEKLLVDIVLFGSALKSKDKPNDIDVVVLLREKNYSKSEDIVYSVTKLGDKIGFKVHCEPLLVDDLHKKSIYKTLLIEGFSIGNDKKLSEMLNFDSYVIVNYSLKGKNNSDKVRFSYALYGRSKGEGVLKEIKGKVLGRGAIMIPVSKIEIIRDFFKQWHVSFKEKNALVFS